MLLVGFLLVGLSSALLQLTAVSISNLFKDPQSVMTVLTGMYSTAAAVFFVIEAVVDRLSISYENAMLGLFVLQLADAAGGIWLLPHRCVYKHHDRERTRTGYSTCF